MDSLDKSMTIPTAFISYSWDSDEHREWVKMLATRLRADGIDVTLDQWHVAPGDQLPKFMEASIQKSDFVLVVCTPIYKRKSEARIGGVGYEGDIITSQIFVSQNQRKYIPILRQGEWYDAAPVWVTGKYYVDLTGNYPDSKYQDLLKTLKGQRTQAPLVGVTLPISTSANTDPPESIKDLRNKWEDIKITGIILEEVTAPRNDGTRGSALYKVPFRLSRQPSSDWIAVFLREWKFPSRATSMHRSNIAHIIGDELILDGTSIDEIEDYHLETLKIVLQDTNKTIADMEATKKQQLIQERESQKRHQDHLKDVAHRLDFD